MAKQEAKKVWRRNVFINSGIGVSVAGTEPTKKQLDAWPADQGDVNKYLEAAPKEK